MSKQGTGSIYLRGTTWWIRYSHRGREFRESSGSASEHVARKLLKDRIKETGKRGGKFIGPAEERMRFEDLAQMLRDDYAANNLRSVKRIEGALKHLSQAFGQDRAVDIEGDRITAYVARRRNEKAANATINRELAALKRAFAIAVKVKRLSQAPDISMLDESGNARQGFVEHADFVALRDALPDRVRDLVSFLYYSGWRVSEAQSLEWSEVETAAVRLSSAKSKTKKGRLLPLSGELAEILARARATRRLDCPYVFHDGGRPILDFRGAWATACAAAGLTGLLVHDLRRSAVRNMVRSGVPERVAMALSGHKTRSVFDRYNIVDEADLTAGIERRDQYLASRPTERKVVPLARDRK